MHNPFKVADINPYGPCDIIVYAFFNVNQTRISPPDGNKYRGLLTSSAYFTVRTFSCLSSGLFPAGHFAQLYSLKEINPELKLVLSVGGWNNSDEFVAMAKNGASRSLFAASIVADLRKWSFDGVDIDWEYPEPENAQDYLSLLQVPETQTVKFDTSNSLCMPQASIIAFSNAYRTRMLSGFFEKAELFSTKIEQLTCRNILNMEQYIE